MKRPSADQAVNSCVLTANYALYIVLIHKKQRGYHT